MIKLNSITLPSLPILGSLGNVVCSDPGHKVRGWRVQVRGPAVFLVSPQGWVAGVPLATLKPGPRRVYELPRAACVMQWDTDDVDAIDKLQRFDGPPMGVEETDQEQKGVKK